MEKEDPFQKPRSRLSQIPSSIWVLGFVSMLMDISSEMIHSLLPLFMITTLGLSTLTIGFIEGLAEATALMVKVFSGALSDYLGKRKGLTVLGYALSAVTKPLFAIASTASMVLTARISDRMGKGIRDAPRDALIADITPFHLRGAAFGLRQSLDTAGAVLGPLLSVGLMLLWANNFRAIFWVAVIPGVLAVLLLIFFFKEPVAQTTVKYHNPMHFHNVKRLGSLFWWVVAVGVVFTLARFSEAFLILRAQQVGVPMALVPLVIIAMNIIYSLTAYPFGDLSDKMSHTKLLTFGLIVLICADLFLAISHHWITMIFGVLLWGVHMGMTQGLLSAMVSKAAPMDLRGTAFGIFNLMNGVTMLISSVIAGLLWEALGSAFTFYAGAAFCVLALVVGLSYTYRTM
ncbi:MAG: MFS transporter [Candidatus Berkiellales bacterium]